MSNSKSSRRFAANSVKVAALFIAVLVLAGCSRGSGSQTSGASPTPGSTTAGSPAASAAPAATDAPTCANTTPTPASTEGPYFKSGSPEKTSLIEAGVEGRRLVLSGSVVTTDCAAIAEAKVDFWQADANGDYDNDGYRLRGHQFTDAKGGYSIETVAPGEYTGRTPHIHVKVAPPGGEVLTTQLYMPDEARNSSDNIFRPELVMNINQDGEVMRGTFQFVLAT